MEKQAHITEKYPFANLVIISIACLIISIIAVRIPFFWDMGYIASVAGHIYNSDFRSFILPGTLDNGTPPLYPVYLATAWKIFGKTLIVNHFAVFPFMVGLLYQVYLLSKKLFAKGFITFALLLIFIDPTIITQYILMGSDILVAFLFLLAINDILRNKRKYFFLAVILIPLINLRGASLVVTLFLFEVFYRRQYTVRSIFLKTLPYYLPSLLVFLGWLAYHYVETGWLLVSQQNEKLHEFIGMKELLLNTIKIFVIAFDFGRIVIWIFIAGMMIKLWRRKISWPEAVQVPVMLLLSFLITYVIFFSTKAYPHSHRYFIPVYIFSALLALSFFAFIRKEIFRKLAVVAFTLALLSGNFWLYPEPYSNGWDASLKVLPYFGLRQDMDQYIKTKDIDPQKVGTLFPLHLDAGEGSMNEDNHLYFEFDHKNMEQFPYILQSNVSNIFSSDELSELRKNWIVEKENSSGQVYIRLYRNSQQKIQ